MSFVIEDLPWEDPALYDEEQLEQQNETLRSRLSELESVSAELLSIAKQRQVLV